MYYIAILSMWRSIMPYVILGTVYWVALSASTSIYDTLKNLSELQGLSQAVQSEIIQKKFK